jgi:hypothetical protein
MSASQAFTVPDPLLPYAARRDDVTLGVRLLGRTCTTLPFFHIASGTFVSKAR